MFKPLHLAQVVILALLMSGCAARQPSAREDTRNAGTTATLATGPDVIAPQHTINPDTVYPPIQAGRSMATTTPWVDKNGQLSPDLQQYAQEVAQTRAIPLDHVRKLLKDAQYDAYAARLMTPSGTRIRRSWVTYRKRFVEPVRINAGVSFWRTNQHALQQATRHYGVPASIIVAIIGVETIYGRNTGNFRVLDALATLGFRYPDPSRPERAQMFRDQLADLIQLDYQKTVNALQITGSFAGAIGLPQFMPGSLMRFAADGNNDGVINLQTSAADAIESVARFLRLHGWQPGLPVFAPVKLPKKAASLVDGGLQPDLSWKQLQQAGAKEAAAPAGVTSEAWKNYKLGVVNLVDEPRNQVDFRTGTPNFFAITKYNHSYFYAASVSDLAQAISERVGDAYTTAAH